MPNYNILFVSNAEHDKDVESILADHGLQIKKISRIQELNEIEELDSYGIVLLDLDMPCVNNNAIYRLRSKAGQAWIIGFSSKPYNPHLKESMRSCMFAVLGKPADVGELMYCIHSLLGQ